MTEFRYGDNPQELAGSVSASQFRGLPDVTIGAEADFTDEPTGGYGDYDDMDTSVFAGTGDGWGDDVGYSDRADASEWDGGRSGANAYVRPTTPRVNTAYDRNGEEEGTFGEGNYGRHIVVTRGGMDYVYPVVRDHAGREVIIGEPVDVIDNRPFEQRMAGFRGNNGWHGAHTEAASDADTYLDPTSQSDAYDDEEPDTDAPLNGLWADEATGTLTDEVSRVTPDNAAPAESAAEPAETVDLTEQVLTRPSVDARVDAVAPVSPPPAGAAEHTTSARGVPIQTAVDMPAAARDLVRDHSLPSLETAQREHAAAVLGVVESVTGEYMDGRYYVDDREGVFVPAPAEHVVDTLLMADPQPGEHYMDIGSGVGHLAFVAGAALGMQAVGCELSTERHEVAKAALDATISEGAITPDDASRIHLVNRNFFDMDLTGVNVFTYADGSGPEMGHIAEHLVREGDEGARVVVYGASELTFPGLELVDSRTMDHGSPTRVRLYRITKR
jgi:hypothetical protein